MNSEDRQDERFDPAAVDEQIERLLQAGDRQHDAGAQIAHDLVGLYQQDTTSLERIWRRLATQHVLTDDSSQEKKEIDTTVLQERDKSMDSNIPARPASARGRTFGRRIAILASVACVVLVVGSLLLVLSMAAQKKHPTGGTTTLGDGTKESDVPGIYLTDTTQSPDAGITISRLDAESHVLLWQRHMKGVDFLLKAVGDTVYGSAFATSANSNSVFALNLNNGSVRWSVNVGWPEFLTSLVVVDGTVYTMSGLGEIYALDSINGKTNWVYDTKLMGGIVRQDSVSVANGVVYDTILNTLVAVDAKKGTLLWSKHIDTPLVFNPPIAVGDTVYVTSHTENNGDGSNQWGFAYAYDAKSGTQKWIYRANTGIGDPMFANGLVLFGAVDHNVYALNAKSGKVVWQSATQGPSINFLSAADGKVFYVGREDSSAVSIKNSLVALDLATGKKLWSLDVLMGLNAFLSLDANAVKDGVAYVGIAPHQVEELRTSDGKVLAHLDVGKFATDVPSVWMVR